MSGTISAKQIVTNPYFAMVVFVAFCFGLPRFGGIAVMLGCASIFSAYVAVLPTSFCNRSGSLLTALCLVAALWVAAVVITAMTMMGELS